MNHMQDLNSNYAYRTRRDETGFIVDVDELNRKGCSYEDSRRRRSSGTL